MVYLEYFVKRLHVGNGKVLHWVYTRTHTPHSCMCMYTSLNLEKTNCRTKLFADSKSAMTHLFESIWAC